MSVPSSEVARLEDYRRRRDPTSVYGHAEILDRWADSWRSLVPGARPAGPVIIGEAAAEPPGWWVCPSCGHRIDRALDAHTVTTRYCTGGYRGLPMHPYVEMTVTR